MHFSGVGQAAEGATSLCLLMLACLAGRMDAVSAWLATCFTSSLVEGFLQQLQDLPGVSRRARAVQMEGFCSTPATFVCELFESEDSASRHLLVWALKSYAICNPKAVNTIIDMLSSML